MKHIRLIFSMLAVATLVVACSEDTTETPELGLDANEIVVGPAGGAQEVKVTVQGRWAASAGEPWVLVSPSNGNGPTVCRIQTDSTLLALDERTAAVRFTSQSTNESQLLTVKQSGFEKALAVSKELVELENYGAYGTRHFDVEVTSNVDFKVEIPEKAALWLSYDTYHFELDRGARPRTTKIRFNWEGNNEDKDREAQIRFVTEEQDLVRHDLISVKQGRAPEITDDRKGDSLAIVVIERKLDMWVPRNYDEPMSMWNGVRCWEQTDEGCTSENIGRVRAIQFQQFLTKEGVPEEVKYLKHLETLSFFSNGSKHLYSFTTLGGITELVNLKYLQMCYFGLFDLPEELKNLKNLVTLDLSSNNFNTVPAVLTPENFPNLKHLSLIANGRSGGGDLTLLTRPKEQWGGLHLGVNTLERLFKWDNLEVLMLSNNLITGVLPDMKNYEKRYTQEEVMQNDTLPSKLIGTPKVLPRCKDLRIGLNYLHGSIPEWVLIHPNLMMWSPDISIFHQQTTYDDKGIKPGFDNAPKSYDYYWDLYPLKKPE